MIDSHDFVLIFSICLLTIHAARFRRKNFLRRHDLNSLLIVYFLLMLAAGALGYSEHSKLTWLPLTLAAAFSIAGNARIRNERLARVKVDEENRVNDIHESYGNASPRTEEQFLMEKIPEDMSLKQGKRIIDAAVARWDREVNGLEKAPDFIIHRNKSFVFKDTKIFFDAITDKFPRHSPPIAYVHVVLAIEAQKTHSGFYEIVHKYRKWFLKIQEGTPVGMTRNEHMLIFVSEAGHFESSDLDMEEDAHGWPGILQPCTVINYHLKDLI